MSPISVFICGDVMPGGVLPYQESYVSHEVLSYIQGFDLRIGNLECAIGTNLLPAPEKLKKNGGNDNVCFARDEDFFRVKELGFDAVSLGNNHSFDLGEEGLSNTIRFLNENGIGYFGAGMNLKEASNPFVVICKGVSICIIGCCIKGLSPKSLIVATDSSYGVYQVSIDELSDQIKSLKDCYDYIIIMPHWGEEHVRIPPIENVKYARRMIDAGADAVFGCHSHCLAPRVVYKGKPIYYGMGNFLDPDKCLMVPRPFYYPKDRTELGTMQRCLNYPWSVSRPTLCICGEDSRLGLAVKVTLDHKMKTEFRIVRLGNDNVLRWLMQYSYLKNFFYSRILMPFAGWLTKRFFYNYIYRLAFRYERRWRDLGDFRKIV